MDFEVIDACRNLIEFAEAHGDTKEILDNVAALETYLDGDADENGLHEPKWCSRKRCKNEATRWYIDALKKDNTVYVCLNHRDTRAAELEGRGEMENSNGELVDLAVYECAPDCDICNS